MDNIEGDVIERDTYCTSWGYTSKGQIGNLKHENFTTNPNKVEIGNIVLVDAAAGENHTIFTDSLSIFGCGSNIYGQLGIGEEEKLLKVFHRAKGIDGKVIQSISCGSEQSFAVTDKGEVYSWGLNFKGQLGSGSFDNRYAPELVENLIPIDEKAMGSSKSSMFFMKRSKSREQMKNKSHGNNQRPSKSNPPDDRNSGDYKDLKPSKSVDLTSKKRSKDGEESYYQPDCDSLLMPTEKVIDIA